ncbi:MAG: efflux RND transporter permease subunit [Aquabacterium sp.]|uniref:efflux RND transporter permease subunit n=1 Tax=Aquabacterium sp. TaxID=1872578 RepID=UPI002728D52D|nr:efflux RND transporter permease subunit [Aquabacterium sp.]MDO9006528.1 efflux RND transporter permease subunit [Aquabacterium sp.]
MKTAVSLPHSLLAWFVANPVAANLLMVLIWLGGLAGLLAVEKDVFPRFSPQQFEIVAIYPGAGPPDVETAVCIPLEEAIHDLPGIKHLDTSVFEGECQLKVSVLPGHPRDTVMSAARGRIDALTHLPAAVEKIDIREAQRDGDDGVIWVALYGEVEPLQLKALGDRIRAELSALPGVTQAVDYGRMNYEISVEVRAASLRQYGLTMAQVATAIRRASLDLAGGTVKTPSGDLLLQVQGSARRGDGVGELVLLRLPDGGVLRIRDVATVHDGLGEKVLQWRHDGLPAQGWEIHAETDAIEVAEQVRAYVQQTAATLPEGVQLKTWWDDSIAFDQRIGTLLEDGLSGFVLVWLVLTLFLRARVAWWAGMGILTSVLGTLWWMPMLGLSLNMLSLFGFLLAMGILVDDAIIIGESVHSEQQKPGADPLGAAIIGVGKVALPVLLSILIALAAFLPGLFLPGWSGEMMRPIVWVMILTLIFSLAEALLILPAHLAVPDAVESRFQGLAHWRERLNRGLEAFVSVYYRPLLEWALSWRYLILALFLALLLLTGGLYASGHVRQAMNPDISKDAFWARLTVPPGTAPAETRRLAERVERELLNYRDALEAAEPGYPLLVGQETLIWEQEAGLWLELSEQARQRVKVDDFVREWRRRIGDLGLARLDFIVREGDVPYDIVLNMGSADAAVLQQAGAALKKRLAAYPGVYDVLDSNVAGKPELQLSLKPAGEKLGLQLTDLAEQVRHAYYGVEAQRFQRGGNDVRVMVRLPAEQRRSLDDLYTLPISLPDGKQTLLSQVAEVDFQPGYAQLTRRDRQRVLEVAARIDPGQADLNAIYADLEQQVLPGLQSRFTGLKADLGRERLEQSDTLHALGRNTAIALTVIYAIIAVSFRSYALPLVFLLAVPMAWCGAVLAHAILGMPLSMESLVGMVAASGVVVNDSMVLLDYIHEHEAQAKDKFALIAEACAARFRPIFLAFLTNFAGFLPTLLETSVQAQFLVPMTLSLAAGLLFGMFASLLLTPVCYAVLQDMQRQKPGN